jgi:CHAD domain-containing protein
MNAQNSHDRLWQKRLAALSAVWPDFLAGDTKALHKARVASRRIREALPVVAASADREKVKKLRRKLRTLTRHLGPIRELDVELAMLENGAVGDAVSRSALSMVRREVAARRLALRHDLGDDPPVGDVRRLVKKLEKIGRADGSKAKKARKQDIAWRSVLAARLVRRAKELHGSIDAAGPLYTPDRVHGVRISTKKLRYALEIAADLGVEHASDLVKTLKRHQERLGRLHDVQGLLKRVREAETSPTVGSRVNDLAAYADLLERECRRLHADFVAHRDALLDCLDEVRFVIAPALTIATRRQARVADSAAAAKGAHGKRAV